MNCYYCSWNCKFETVTPAKRAFLARVLALTPVRCSISLQLSWSNSIHQPPMLKLPRFQNTVCVAIDQLGLLERCLLHNRWLIGWVCWTYGNQRISSLTWVVFLSLTRTLSPVWNQSYWNWNTSKTYSSSATTPWHNAYFHTSAMIPKVRCCLLYVGSILIPIEAYTNVNIPHRVHHKWPDFEFWREAQDADEFIFVFNLL